MKIFTFTDTDSALDWRNDRAVNIGDVLVIESEQVVAVASPFDFAVTVKQGKMGEFLIDQPTGPNEFLQLVTSIRCAVAEANRLGYEVVPQLVSICS
jgi:hypothetical protein